MGAAAKICGVTTAQAVQAALDGGAVFIGFNFFTKSPRYISPEAAARLAEPVRGKLKVVAVMVDPSDAEADRIAQALHPDLIQLHGAETPSRARAVAERARAGLVKALPMAEEADLSAAADFDAIAEHLMFDTKPAPDAQLPGGTGRTFDWGLLAGRRFRRPFLLAGG